MKILVVAGHAPSLINFRGPLLAALQACGHELCVAAPDLLSNSKTVRTLHERSVVTHDAYFERTGLSPVSDLRACLKLVKLMRQVKPDVVLAYAIKPVIWGTLAAALARVPHRFALITGLGYAFTGKPTGKRAAIQKIARKLYATALRRSHKVFFQNPDDEALFRSLDILPPQVPSVVVNGSGVDLVQYPHQPLPDTPPTFLMIARVLGDKGIREYVSAAFLLKQTHPHATFHLVGDVDDNPNAIPRSEVEAWHASGNIVWHGHQADVKPFLAMCHVFVLPSYREGTPRSILEAMATGRTIVTTDAPGCRETVIEGKNGFMVPVGQIEPLVDAMTSLIKDRQLISDMGTQSLMIAQSRYDVDKVNSVMLTEMGLMNSTKSEL